MIGSIPEEQIGGLLMLDEASETSITLQERILLHPRASSSRNHSAVCLVHGLSAGNQAHCGS
jgi:hypothetical protein